MFNNVTAEIYNSISGRKTGIYPEFAEIFNADLIAMITTWNGTRIFTLTQV